MDTTVSDGPNSQFQSGEIAKSAFSDDVSADLAANAADIALLIDDRGVIRDAAFSGEELSLTELGDWVGTPWIETVRTDSRPKIEKLLDSALSPGERRWRHVNHVQPSGPDLPVRYMALPTRRKGWVLAIGRDLRAASRMQQRLIEAQRAMEQDYARVREAETRFRLLFQMTSEGVVIVEDDTFKITDLNQAAARLIGGEPEKLEGRALDQAFGAEAAIKVREALAVARRTGRTEQIELDPGTMGGKSAHEPVVLRTSVYRESRQGYFLLRLAARNPKAGAQGDASLARLAEVLPDALILAGEDGKILSVNAAFADLAQLPGVDAALGEPLETYLGRSETELNVLMANLREHGTIRNFTSSVRSPLDLREPVEVSAVAAPGPSGTVFGFSVRAVGRRLVEGRRSETGAVPGNVDKLSDLVGRLALKDIVRESTDMIERGCIEAALKLTNNNRASAAEILGLSRQSLYAKMHRHKIGELAPKSEH